MKSTFVFKNQDKDKYMPPFNLANPTLLATELGYTMITVFLCFMIYYKTKEIYDLTNHEGVKYFRRTFLFFGLAFLFRFVSIFTMLVEITFDMDLSMYLFRIFPLVLNGYFSTMAILSLTYSIIWKELQTKHLLMISNAIALLISGIAFFSRSSILLILAQTVLLISTIVLMIYFCDRTRRISKLFILYVLFFLFWIVNLFALGPRFLPFEVHIIFQIISVAVIGIIYHKVARWTS